ncbi:MAG: helix-turn-helix domain-containing protein [Anaerolineales bacterium]|nr:helix-turn-helix domain-containing protein [Anaerolineales bacterium]
MGTLENEFHAVDVGSRLRQLRTERGKSMRALARASGLSTNALSMIERGRASPSVSTLYKLADALGVPITAFFRLEPPRQDIVFRRTEERQRVDISYGTWEGLGGESFTGRMEPFILTLESGGGSGPFGMLHTGNEFVMCLGGQIEYEVEDQKFTLNPGDSLLFAAQLRHRWRNLGEETANAILVLAGFEQGERPSEFHLSSGMKVEIVEDDKLGGDAEIAQV